PAVPPVAEHLPLPQHRAVPRPPQLRRPLPPPDRRDRPRLDRRGCTDRRARVGRAPRRGRATPRTAGSRAAAMTPLSLMADHTLVLQVDSRLVPLVERWLPRYLDEPSPAVTPGATIEAVVAASEAPRPAGAATRAGKSTAGANLVRSGWAYLSDDQVVLSSRPGGVVAEGWLRPFHLDRGWVEGEGDEGEPGGDRSEVMPSALAPDGRRRSAP